MKCHDVRQHWMLYLDSEGDAELHFRMSDHLGMCPSCAEWFAQQTRFEQGLTERLRAGGATPDLWQRALANAGLQPRQRAARRWLLGVTALAAAAVLAIAVTQFFTADTHPSELGRFAADLHQQVVQGTRRPDLVSSSDRQVEDHLRKQVSFPVHCPPRKDANFTLQGAGVCRVKEWPAAFIVGHVDDAPISILVFDRASLNAFPHERNLLGHGSGRYHCREGEYQMVSGIVADNLVVIIGAVTPDVLERLLNAYGSYHEG